MTCLTVRFSARLRHDRLARGLGVDLVERIGFGRSVVCRANVGITGTSYRASASS
jgi:hypothetical protein